MTTDITELALIKGQKVEAPYYLAECTECGKMYSSSKLIVSHNYFDGDADCYCPHCNADDADIADLGSGEQPAAMAWNYQQARIDTLVEALEKAQQPVVPPMQHWEELCREHPDMSIGDAIIRAAWWNHCRAAMLQAGNSPVIPDGLIAAVNRLLDSDGSRGCYSAIRCRDARAEVERLLATAPQEVPDGK